MTDFVAAATGVAERIEKARPLNAVLAFDRGVLLADAERLAREKVTGPLAGMALAVKDNICTREYPTTCGSRILEGYRSPFEATAIRHLRAAGAMIACKANLDEFAMGSSTEYSAFGRVHHPMDPDRVPGGSSGGSAALVAAGTVDAALGSETGGSVRQPAAFCGVVGIKPTYGRVSRYGLVAFGSSLDQIGIAARSVADAGRVLAVISQPDARDSTWATGHDVLSTEITPRSFKGLRIGRPKEYFPDSLAPAIRRACDSALDAMRAQGAEIVDVSLPSTGYAIPCYYVIAPAEASSNLARFDGARYGPRLGGAAVDVQAMYRATRGAGFGAEVRRRIIIGTFVLSSGYHDAYYTRALRVRGMLLADFLRVLGPAPHGVDLLFTPTTPTTAFKAGDNTADPVAMYLADIFTCPANLAGVPAVSLPIGRSEGLPIGGQFIAPRFGEARMLAAAAALEAIVASTAEVR
ncbi:MAG TPA: Asp-tRNA(Asn)/Glu-tRNA(Gln) amidotransferase subunit GatA [Gemmatimonadales bacterium]